MENTMVEIRVVSQETDKTISLSPDDALYFLVNEIDKNRKWIYVNFYFEDPRKPDENQSLILSEKIAFEKFLLFLKCCVK